LPNLACRPALGAGAGPIPRGATGHGATAGPAPADVVGSPCCTWRATSSASLRGQARFVVAGHDRSSPVAASVGLFRPDMVHGCRSHYTGGFQRSALYWYRTSKLNREADGRFGIMPRWQCDHCSSASGTEPSLIRLLPGSSMPRTVLRNGCGHWAQQQRLDQINELLLQFLANHQTSGRAVGRDGLLRRTSSPRLL
jgi:hypothetical protein